MENQNFISLYDFLGKPAGGQLGKQVFEEAKRRKERYEMREIANRKYVGQVVLYRPQFLTEYFNLTK
jgi:hypothetical protein